MKVLVVLTALLVGVDADGWLGQTSRDNNFDKTCSNDQTIYRLQSSHSNHQEDRWWDFYCKSGYNLNDNNPDWTSYQNNWDGNLDYKCGDNKALVGLSSTHHNNKEDRRWRFKCKNFNGVRTYDCAHTDYINNMDGWMDKSVGSTNKILNGLYSNHDNHHEDRKWKMYVCNLCSESVTWSSWSSWGTCSQSCTHGGTGATQRRQRTCSNARPQPKCSDIKCQTEYQSQQCNYKHPCPARVDGGWSCWSSWSTCSTSCGIGVRTRTRSCNNPSPALGGSTCPGASSETKRCNTAEYEPIPSSGISGHDDKTINSASLSDCIKRCTEETSFKCASFEYQSTSRTCRLGSKKQTSSGVNFVTGGAFTSYTYYERKCKANTVQTVQQRTINTFSDGCHTSNCYSTCGESNYMNKVVSGNEITLRYIRFDLSQLPSKLSGQSPSKVTVHAQTVVLNGRLDISYDLVIVARQVHLGGSASFRYKDPQSRYYNVNQCAKSFVYLDCSINSPMTLVSYYGNGRIDIYAEGIQGGVSCEEGKRMISQTPMFDVTALKAALACAEDVAAASSSGHTLTAYNIASYIKHVTSDLSGFANSNEARSLRTYATSLYNLMDLRKEGKRKVPVLSQSSYSSMLGRYSTIFQVYHSRFDNIFSSSVNINNRITDLSNTVEQSKDALRLQEKKLEFAQHRLKESERTIEKMNAEFVNASETLTEAQKEFEKGMESFKQQQRIRAGFQFVQVIGQITSAAAGVADAKGSDSKGAEKVFEMIESITDLVAEITGLAETIKDMAEMTQTISDVQSTGDDLKETVDGLNVPEDADSVMASMEGAANMKVQIVVWENLKNTADTQLTGDPVEGIDGAQKYHKAMADIANWGKAIAEQTLLHADLINEYLVEALAKENAQARVTQMENLLRSAESSRTISNQLLQEVADEVVDVQFEAMQLTLDFCRSYYYFNLQECKSTLHLHLADTLTQTRQKLAEFATSTLEAAEAFGTKTPQPFNAHHVLVDKVSHGCTKPEDCPITTIKTTKRLLMQIPMSSTNFQGLDRVRIDEIRVFFGGVQFTGSPQKIKVFFDSLGEMQDRYSGTNYDFIAVDRQLTFTFDYTSRQITDYACVRNSANYYQLTPFGNWALELKDPTNSLNLSQMNRVEIYFIGSAIKSGAYRPSVPGNLYHVFGEADRSLQCAGGGRVNKRSLRLGARKRFNLK